ncbi:MAG: hypothetical protein ABIQ88_04710 [Chitinophagaceae bacterium]
MNTLNYKVLLVRTGLIVFIRAMGIYLLLTIPALAALPAMYLLSAGYALSFGWIAAIFFLIAFYLLRIMKMSVRARHMLLYMAAAVAVLIAFQMMEITGAWDHIWQSGAFLLFPGAAVMAGWISLAVSGKAINRLFAPPYPDYHSTIIDNHSSATENSI